MNETTHWIGGRLKVTLHGRDGESPSVGTIHHDAETGELNVSAYLPEGAEITIGYPEENE